MVNYTTNEEKVSSDDYINLHNAVEYIEVDYKTESKQYASTLNCGVTTAYEEMKITKEPYKKNIRVHRSFGKDYTMESIKSRISKDFITTELTDEVKKPINMNNEILYEKKLLIQKKFKYEEIA